MVHLRDLGGRVQRGVDPGAVGPARRTGPPSIRFRPGRHTEGTRFQHCRQLRDQHQLAVLFGRVRVGLHRAGDRSDRAELPVRWCRDGRGGRPDPRAGPPAHRQVGQLLGRPDQDQPAAPAAVVVRRRVGHGGRWCHPKPLRTSGCDHPGGWDADTARWPGGLAGGDQAAGNQRGRLFQCELLAPVRKPDGPAEPLGRSC